MAPSAYCPLSVGIKPERCTVKSRKFSNIFLVVSLFCAATTIAASAQTITTLVNFNGTNGSRPGPQAPLVQATDGNLYGVTDFGGTPTSCIYTPGTGCGTFFKITPAGELSVLYSFCSLSKCADGANPVSLIQASNGNFYGVTEYGGPYSQGGNGYGTVFQITPSGVMTTIYAFCAQAGCPDGNLPVALLQASNGNFYGVAASGANQSNGTVFTITPAGKFTKLYSFCAQTGCPDGGFPGTLMQASNKNLYGSTGFGGAHNGGTLFEITPAGQFTNLYSFVHSQVNTMILGGDGNIYGTQGAGGFQNHGTVFKLTPQGQVTYLHSFCQLNCATGDSPLSGLVEGSDGNFYGTNYLAGITYYAGSIFGMTPTGGFDTLYLFCSQTNCDDGWGGGAIMQATNGTFYGMTVGGGISNGGTIFTLSRGLGPFVAAKPGFGSAGQVVRILGNNLTGTTSITFNGVTANFKVVSDTYIQVQVPTGATTGMIQVTTPSGTLTSNIDFLVP